MPQHYILVNGKIQPAELLEWAEWWGDDRNKRIEFTEINSEVCVSTVFLGLDHNFGGNGSPVLFETMIFGGPYNEHQERYTTLGAAKRGHYRIVQALREGIDPQTGA